MKRKPSRNTRHSSSGLRKRRNNTLLGRSITGDRVYFPELCHHIHVLGKSGSGKSSFLLLLMQYLLFCINTGFALLDPHGSLCQNLLDLVAKKYPHLAQRFLVLSLNNPNLLLGFNPIPKDAQHPLRIHVVCDALIDACLKVWGHDPQTLPRTVRWLYNVFYLMIRNNLAFADLVHILNINKDGDQYRKKLLAAVDDPAILNDWHMFLQSSLPRRQELLEAVGNRLRSFVTSPILRAIFQQHSPQINIGQIMEERKILLVDLNGADLVSAENSRLFGVLLLNEFFRAAKLRNHRDPHLSKYFLVLDEFSELLSLDTAKQLDQTRKFQLFTFLSHQSLSQLKTEDEILYGSVMTNTVNKIVFGISADDAEIMTKELAPGYIDLKTMKDEIYQTKFRPIEEVRTVISTSTGTSEAESETHTQSQSQTQSNTQGRSKAFSATISTAEGGAETFGTAHSRGISVTAGTSQSTSHAQGTSRSRSQGRNASSATGRSHAQGHSSSFVRSLTNSRGSSQGQSHSETTGASSSQSQSHSHSQANAQGTAHNRNSTQRIQAGEYQTQYGQGSSHSKNQTQGHTDGVSSSTGTSRNASQSVSHGYNISQAEGHTTGLGHHHSIGASSGKNRGTSRSHSAGKNISHSQQQGTSHSVAHSQQMTNSRSQTKNWSTSHGRSTTETTSSSITAGSSSSQGKSKGKTRSKTQGRSQSIIPYDRKEAFRELSSRSYYTKDELLYLFMSGLKNQPVGHAVLKWSDAAPLPVAVCPPPVMKYNIHTSPLLRKLFLEHLHAHNGQYYVAVPEPEVSESQEDEPLPSGGIFNE